MFVNRGFWKMPCRPPAKAGCASSQNPTEWVGPASLPASLRRPRAGSRKSEEAMKNFTLKVQRFLVSEDGPTAVEYAVMLALIIIVCLTAITSVGTNASAVFQNVSTSLSSASGS